MALPLSYNIRNIAVRWQVTALAVGGIALVVAQSAFPKQAEHVLPALLAYLIMESLVTLVYVRWLRRRHAGADHGKRGRRAKHASAA